MNQLLTIVGPTAVGKTELTLALAKEYGVPVISGDAYQVYRGLDIGSAKPTKEELGEVMHYLIDILNPDEPYSVADFQMHCRGIIETENQKGHAPILSGGTGLYVQAFLEGYQFSEVAPDTEVRKRLEALYELHGMDGLVAYAKQLANAHGISIPYTDLHRLYRAIERMEAGDIETLYQQNKEGRIYKGPVIGLMRDRDVLYQRINQRVDMMLQQGLVEEVESLHKRGFTKDYQSMKGIGYKELLDFFEGECDLGEAIERIKKNTRNFAKRQITWYKRMPYIEWIYIDETTTPEDILKKAKMVIDKEKNK